MGERVSRRLWVRRDLTAVIAIVSGVEVEGRLWGDDQLPRPHQPEFHLRAVDMAMAMGGRAFTRALDRLRSLRLVTYAAMPRSGTELR